MGSCCDEFLWELGVEVRPWQASVLACVVLAGTVRDLRVQEFLRELIVGVAAPSDLVRSIIVKILHCSEGGDVKQVARTSKQFSRVCDCSSLSTYLCLYLTCLLSLCSSIICLILLVLNRYTCLGYLISWIVIIIYSLHA